MDYRNVITIEPGKRGGRPCVRGLRITVADVGWLAAGMSHDEILADHPELTEDDICACLAYVADGAGPAAKAGVEESGPEEDEGHVIRRKAFLPGSARGRGHRVGQGGQGRIRGVRPPSASA